MSILAYLMFAIVHFSKQFWKYLGCLARDMAVSISLKQDIHHEYVGTSFIDIIIPLVILVISCLFLIDSIDRKKFKVKKER